MSLHRTEVSSSGRPVYGQDEIECIIIPQVRVSFSASEFSKLIGEKTTCQEIRLSTHRLFFYIQVQDVLTHVQVYHIPLYCLSGTYQAKKGGLFSSPKVEFVLEDYYDSKVEKFLPSNAQLYLQSTPQSHSSIQQQQPRQQVLQQAQQQEQLLQHDQHRINIGHTKKNVPHQAKEDSQDQLHSSDSGPFIERPASLDHHMVMVSLMKMTFKSNKLMEQFVEVLDRQLKIRAWEKKVVPEASFGLMHAGIGGLQRRREETSTKQQDSLQESFKDLESLMAYAKDLVHLARKFNADLDKRKDSLPQSQVDSDIKAFDDMLMEMGMTESIVSKEVSGNRFHEELAKELVDFFKKPLERSKGVITLVDAYCLYNRARGTDLISPEDMRKACSMLETLNLPMRMKTFKSGVIVLTSSLNPSKDFFEAIKPWLRDEEGEYTGLSIIEAAHKLKISIALAESRLLELEQEELLCRDEFPQGIFFYENFFHEVH